MYCSCLRLHVKSIVVLNVFKFHTYVFLQCKTLPVYVSFKLQNLFSYKQDIIWNVFKNIWTMATDQDYLIGIFSRNCKGLGNKEKCRQVFHFLGKNSSILSLKETPQWTFLRNIGGVNGAIKLYSWYPVMAVLTAVEHVSYSKIILIWKLQNTNATVTEGFIIADNITEGEKITLVSLYAPDGRLARILWQSFRHLERIRLWIINCVLNPILDKKGGRPHPKPNCRPKLLTLKLAGGGGFVEPTPLGFFGLKLLPLDQLPTAFAQLFLDNKDIFWP